MESATAATLAPEKTPVDMRTDEQRDKDAAAIVSHYAAWSAAAGVIPIPMVDMFAVGGVQMQMLRKLAENYSVPFQENLGKSFVASLVGSLIPASAATTTAMGVSSLLKAFPIVGTTLASLSMPALSAAATYAVGKVFIQHFASGGTLLDFNPEDYREFMKTQAAKAKAAGTSIVGGTTHAATPPAAAETTSRSGTAKA